MQPPEYVWLTAVVSVSARPRYDPSGVRTEVLRALYSLFHPLYGGPDGTGWPLGRSVQSHEVHAALARIAGVDMSREVNVALFPADPETREALGGGATARPARPRAGLLLRAPGPGQPMRGTVPGLRSPLPLADTLPGLLRTDLFAEGLCSSFDEVLAPVLLSLDGFSAYLDLATAPEDMVEWLATWMGMSVDPNAELPTQRELLQASGELHARRGTRRGLELAVQSELGVPVQVVETGAAAWSSQPGGDLPGDPVPAVVVVARPQARSGRRGGAAGCAGPGDQARPRAAPGAGRSRIAGWFTDPGSRPHKPGSVTNLFQFHRSAGPISRSSPRVEMSRN